MSTAYCYLVRYFISPPFSAQTEQIVLEFHLNWRTRFRRDAIVWNIENELYTLYHDSKWENNSS